MPENNLLISEIFKSIQGESTYVGLPCIFVRLTGCNLRCTYCDTEYAFYDGKWMRLEEILDEVASFGVRLVEVTGGEPLLQPAVYELVRKLCDQDYKVLVETGGQVDISPVDQRATIVMDIKCPGSGEAEKNRWENLDHLKPSDEVKFVIADRPDFDWAIDVARRERLCEKLTVLFSPVQDQLDPTQLAEWVLQENLPLRFQHQLHKLLWPEVERGV